MVFVPWNFCQENAYRLAVGRWRRNGENRFVRDDGAGHEKDQKSEERKEERTEKRQEKVDRPARRRYRRYRRCRC